MAARGRVVFSGSWLIRHDNEVLALSVVYLVVCAHLLGGIETRFALSEAAIAGIIGCFQCYLRAEQEKVYGIESPFTRTPTQYMVIVGIVWMVVYVGVMAIMVRVPAGIVSDSVAIGLLFPLGVASLAVPYLIAEDTLGAEPAKEERVDQQ